MDLIFTILTVGIAMSFAATVIVLLIGVGAMAKGGEFNRLHSNKLMRLRVLFQGLAIVQVIIYLGLKSFQG